MRRLLGGLTAADLTQPPTPGLVPGGVLDTAGVKGG